jgi:hypothetical protein
VLLNSRLNTVVTGSVLYADQGVVGGMLTGTIDPHAMSRGAKPRDGRET